MLSKKKALILALIFLGAVGKKFLDENSSSKNFNGSTSINKQLKSKPLVFTKHALCRMDCRNIDREEVGQVLSSGSVNLKKTKKNQTPCPTYALEYKTKDRQQVRAVFAKCSEKTKLITVIDLNNKYNCVCD